MEAGYLVPRLYWSTREESPMTKGGTASRGPQLPDGSPAGSPGERAWKQLLPNRGLVHSCFSFFEGALSGSPWHRFKWESPVHLSLHGGSLSSRGSPGTCFLIRGMYNCLCEDTDALRISLPREMRYISKSHLVISEPAPSFLKVLLPSSQILLFKEFEIQCRHGALPIRSCFQ
eukprot:jgi/Botrbrau1/21151/Bobra.0061s0045.1